MKRMIVTAVAALAIAGCGEEDLGGAPNVQGLDLETARQQLERSGWGVSVKDDALFGVIVESHFTVCEQKSPNGKLVPLEVSKNC